MTLVCVRACVLCWGQPTHAGECSFVIHCCRDLRWLLIWMCAGVQSNKIWQEIRRQRAAFKFLSPSIVLPLSLDYKQC